MVIHRAHKAQSTESVRNTFVRVIRTFLASNKRTLLARIQGLGVTGIEDSDTEVDDECEVIQPLGFIARPNPNANDSNDTNEALVFRDGDEVVVLCMINKGLQTLTDSELNPGETLMYGAQSNNVSAQIRIKANGDIIVKPKAGQKVYLGDETGTQPIMRGTDLSNHLSTIVSAINSLRSDMVLVSAHAHAAFGAVSPTLGTVPTGSAPSSVPALSTVVESK